MDYGLYNGNSDGFKELVNGYVDYAKEVIARRSFPDLRDGLKPVARRTIYTFHKMKVDSLKKSGALVGRVMELHPHSDSSIYLGMCAMTDRNGSMNVPYLIGQGSFGKVHSSDSPAAMRYTKAKCGDYFFEFLRDMDVCEYKPAEEGEGLEPTVLPVRYPVVLVNGTMGMAVSVSTNIPSFTFDDVIDLTIKYLENGNLKIEDMIVPSFPSGGILVRDDQEIAKIMLTGKGKLKIRAKIEVVGKEILVKEVPYGLTVESILRAINEAKVPIKGIDNAINTTGKDSRALLTITCKSKKVVDEVILELYRRKILQNTFSSNMLLINNEEPRQIGVYDTIKEWVEWRRTVLIKKAGLIIQDLDKKICNLSYFIRLVSNQEWCDTYTDLVLHTKKGAKAAASKYLHEIFEDIPEDSCAWIYERGISAFNNGGKYRTQYDNLLEDKSRYEGYLSDIDSWIIQDLKELKADNAGKYPRKTEVTYKDYKFSKITDSVLEDTSYCVYTLYKDGFLKKSRDVDNSEDVMYNIEAQANSVLVGFDNFGRLLRVIGSEIPFTQYGTRGTYLPKYFEVDDSYIEEYKVLYMGLLDGRTRMLIYKDGYVGFFNTDDLVGKKRTKIVYNGVDTYVYDRLVDVVEPDDIPEYLVVADDHSSRVRFGVAEVAGIKVKSRRSRTKVFSGTNVNINYWGGRQYMELLSFMSDVQSFIGKLKPYKKLYHDPDFMNDGKLYVEGSLIKPTTEES